MVRSLDTNSPLDMADNYDKASFVRSSGLQKQYKEMDFSHDFKILGSRSLLLIVETQRLNRESLRNSFT